MAATGGANPAAAAPDATPSVSIDDHTTAPGQRVLVSGRAAETAGRSLTVEYARGGGAGFRALKSATVGRGGRYRIRATPPATGRLRVSVVRTDDGTTVVSRTLPVRVVKRFDVGKRRLHVRAGQTAVVRGHGAPGEVVRLQTRRDGRWHTLTRTRVRSGGKFAARAHAATPMSVRTRLVSAGRTRRSGRLEVYRSANVSWYGPGLYGNHLGCGGTLQPGTLGVANKSLPCGTRLTLRHGRHSVRVRVIDRGPYVGGREFDLTAATARRLHFGGVGAVLVTR